MTTGKRVFQCRYCAEKIEWPAESWPPLMQTSSGHFHRFEAAPRGRPPKPPEEPAVKFEPGSDELGDDDDGLCEIYETARRVKGPRFRRS